ncbi:MAG TPA: PQQ-binding-like beta-propeller repeat protein [Streptosporangiaceae bacterium]|nr:PQQ-binding-like beta-propeller repeat protein [Streptosporangiaceae bacterium]
MTGDHRGHVGLPLTDAIGLFGPLPEVSVRALGAHLAEEFAAAHATGRIMRNLTPSRVLLTASRPSFIDAAAESVTGETSPEAACYLAPEQVTVTGDAGPASDVFSLGAILVFAATSTSPFGTGEIQDLLHRVVHEEPTLEALPATLRPLLAACLDKNPAARPPADAIADWLAPAGPEVLLTAPLRAEITRREREASPPCTQDQRPGARSLNRRRVLGIAAGAFIGGGSITLALTDGRARSERPSIPRLVKPWVYTPPDYITNGQLAAVGRTVVWFSLSIALGIDAITGSKVWTAILPEEVEWWSVSGATLLGIYTESTNVTGHILGYDAATGRPRFDRVLSQRLEAAEPGLELIDAAGGIALITDNSLGSTTTLWAVSLSTGQTLWTRTGSINAATTDGRSCFLLDGSGPQRLDMQTGTPLWTAHEAVGMNKPLSKLIVSDSTLVVMNNKLLALDAQTGHRLWATSPTADIGDIAAQDGRVFAAVGYGGDSSGDSALWALSTRTGFTLWSTSTESMPPVSAAYGQDPGRISGDRDLLALSYLGSASDPPSPSGFTVLQASTGRLLGSHRDQDGNDQWAVLAAGGNIYAATAASLYAFPGRYWHETPGR